jgi:hypothetical protein
MKIAIVGAGIFGCTLSLILSKNKSFEIDLFEKKKDIMQMASKYNQQRFHHGFHYPRSQNTIKEILKSKKSFENFYGTDIFGKTKNFYGLVEKNGKINKRNFINILKKNNLKYINSNHKNFSTKIDFQILTDEKILNYFKLKKKIISKIKKSKIRLHLNKDFNLKNCINYDYIFVCTYFENNKNLANINIKNLSRFRYELIEKIVIELPKKYRNLSYVIIDGKFLCLDPYVGTNYHLLSHVKYSKLEIKNSIYAKFKNKNFKNVGQFIKLKKNKRFINYINDGKKYLPFLIYAKYIGSFFGVRTIEIKKEITDQRTNILKKHSSNIFSIYSGKWNTAIDISLKIKKYLEKK